MSTPPACAPVPASVKTGVDEPDVVLNTTASVFAAAESLEMKTTWVPSALNTPWLGLPFRVTMPPIGTPVVMSMTPT